MVIEKKYNTKDASDYLKEVHGVEEKAATLEVKRSQGRGPDYVKVEGRVYYPKSSLDRYAAGTPVHTNSCYDRTSEAPELAGISTR